MNALAAFLGFAGFGLVLFALVQCAQLLGWKRGSWWSVVCGISASASCFGFSLMLNAGTWDPTSVSSGEAANLGEIIGICGVSFLLLTVLAWSGLLTKKIKL